MNETWKSMISVNMAFIAREAVCSERILAKERGKMCKRGLESPKLQLHPGFELIWGGNAPRSLESDLCFFLTFLTLRFDIFFSILFIWFLKINLFFTFLWKWQ